MLSNFLVLTLNMVFRNALFRPVSSNEFKNNLNLGKIAIILAKYSLRIPIELEFSI